MRTLVFANRKGGVGKTTLAGHIGVAAAATGEAVVLMDTDPQGSLAEWWNGRARDDVRFASAQLSGLLDQLRLLKEQGTSLVIIDTPPAVTATIATVVAAADLVVVPIRPSPHDLRAVVGTVELCKRRPVFILNGAAARARITAEAAIALSQFGAVAPTIIHQRTNFAGSMADGRVINELDPRGRGASEVDALWDYLSHMLHVTEGTPA